MTLPSPGQIRAVLKKQRLIDQRHACRSICECLFPLTILAAITIAFEALGEPFLDFMQGGVTEVLLAPSLLPAVQRDPFREACDGTPRTLNLQATEPPEGDFAPPCFSSLDNEAIALQCRCRTLKLAGVPELRDGFAEYLRSAGVVDMIQVFTDKWRAQKAAECPERQVLQLVGGYDVDVGREICGLINFVGAGEIEVKMDATADAGVYRSTPVIRPEDIKTIFEADECRGLPWWTGRSNPCRKMYDVYQRHAHASLMYMAGRFLAQRTSAIPVVSPESGNASIAIFTLPLPERLVQERGDSFVAAISSWAAFFITFPFILWVFVLVSALIRERELRQKEGMLVMGLGRVAYYLSWFIYVFLRASSLALVMGLLALLWPLSATGFFAFSYVLFSGLMHTYAFSAVFSTVFSNERTGAMLVAMLYFLLMIPVVVRQVTELPAIRSFLLVFPSSWTAICIQQVIFMESMSWAEGLELNGVTTGYVIGVGNLCAVCWYLLYLYLEQVVKQTVGRSRSIFFPCQPSFWREMCGMQKDSVSIARAPSLAQPGEGVTCKIEKVLDARLLAQEAERKVVKISNLQVVFQGVHGEEIRAVDDLSFTMYTGEIFVLLGHNGAGKTTTISVLSGIYPSTGGSVEIMDKTLPADLQKVRRSLGFCPQHNVLWDEMTCLEHLVFFVSMRGKSESKTSITTMSQELLVEIGLASRINHRSSELSGGMKRKLSVAIAFNGNPDFVILDEPTSGMDPFSRRVLWDFVKHRRAERVVLLTTHFMDEADVLSDRIAIMAHGKLQSYGDPQFLKRSFGCGYVISIVLAESSPDKDDSRKSWQKANDSSTERKALKKRLEADIVSRLSGYKVQVDSVGKEMLVRVPFDDAECLPVLFSFLDQVREDGAVATYGAGVSSLEEVFLQIANANFSQAPGKENAGAIEEDSGSMGMAAMPAGTVFWDQAQALLVRRVRSGMRDRRTFCLLCGVAPLTLLIGVVMCFFVLQRLENVTETFERALPGIDTSKIVWGAINTSAQSGLPGTRVAFSEMDLQNVSLDLTNRTLSPVILGGSQFNPPANASQIYPPAGYCSTPARATGNVSDCEERWKKHVLLFSDKVLATRQEWDMGILFIDEYPTLWANDAKFIHSVPMAINGLMDAFYGSNPETTVGVSKNQPSEEQQALQLSQADLFRYVMPVILVSVAFAFIPTGVLQFIMLEKVSGAKDQLFISGCKSNVYWLTNLLWDSIFGLVPVLFSCLFFVAFDLEHFKEEMGLVVFFMVFFIPGACGFAYVCSQLVSSENMATTSMLALNGLIGTVLVLMVMIADMVKALLFLEYLTENTGNIEEAIEGDSTIQVLGIIKDIAQVFGALLPGFSLASGLLRISLRHLFSRNLIPGIISGPLLDALRNPVPNPLAGVDIDLPENLNVDVNTNVSQVISAVDPAIAALQNVSNESLPGLVANLSSVIGVNLTVPGVDPRTIWNAVTGAAVNATNPVAPQLQIAQTLLDNANTVVQTLDLANLFIDNLLDTVSNVSLTRDELGDFIDKQLLPPITLSMGFQACYFGSNFLGPFELSSTQSIGPLTVQVPCGFLTSTNGDGGLGAVIEDITGVFVAGDAMINSVILAIFWPLLAIGLELLLQSPNLSRYFVPKDEVPQGMQNAVTDPDVEAERARVEATSPGKQIILVRNLRRVYKRPNLIVTSVLGVLMFTEIMIMLVLQQSIYVILAVNIPLIITAICLSSWWAPLMFRGVKKATHAVRGVSWATDTGMVLGLLGVNGAGKTSTFEMMAGLRTPSEGEVYICGFDVLTQVEACRKFIGYCPQFDRLIAHLTPVDHLYLFGRIKGLRKDQLADAVSQKMEQLQLTMYADRYAGTLSGGNKRKLSVANALIGEPPIVFLDEPSTGMDPFARRFMWQVIDDVAEQRKKSVVVLTTHSMEEAEALCSKITIQVDGSLRCFGSSQQVKSRYGSGYEVPVKFNAVTEPHREATLKELASHGLEVTVDDILTCEQVFAALDANFPEKLERSLGEGSPFSHGTTQAQAQVFIDWWVLDSLVASLLEFLARTYGKVICLEHYGLSARFRLPELEASQLASLFEALLTNKDLHLIDFSVCQSSLEMIFNSFAKLVGKPPQSLLLDEVPDETSQPPQLALPADSMPAASYIGLPTKDEDDPPAVNILTPKTDSIPSLDGDDHQVPRAGLPTVAWEGAAALTAFGSAQDKESI